MQWRGPFFGALRASSCGYALNTPSSAYCICFGFVMRFFGTMTFAPGLNFASSGSPFFFATSAALVDFEVYHCEIDWIVSVLEVTV